MDYEDLGDPDMPPLVLLHNCTASGIRAWSNQFEALGAHFRLIVPDVRSHDATNNPGGVAPMKPRHCARDTFAMCLALGVERA